MIIPLIYIYLQKLALCLYGDRKERLNIEYVGSEVTSLVTSMKSGSSNSAPLLVV